MLLVKICDVVLHLWASDACDCPPMMAASTVVPDFTAMLLPAAPQSKDVYELYGEEGSGKTQCLLHLIATYILPERWNGHEMGGKDTGVVYVDNDYHFNVLRLTVIMEHRIIKTVGDDVLSDEQLDTFIKQCLKKLYLVRCSSSAQLIVTLYSLEPILKNQSVCVLMVDSIASFYWIDRSNGAENLSAQEANLVQACTAIDDLRDRHGLIVYATKPAIFTRKVKDNDDGSEKTLDHCEYLCKKWQRMVTHRLLFSKNSEYQSFHVKTDKSVKKMERNFTIGDSGLVFAN